MFFPQPINEYNKIKNINVLKILEYFIYVYLGFFRVLS
jgi:hypothetical protein